MTQDTAVELARRYVEEVINNHRTELVDVLFAPTAVFNDPVAPGGVARGREEITAFFAAVQQAMPDLHFAIEDIFGRADSAVWRGTLHVTLKGAFGPLPGTGKSASASIAEIFRVANGQITDVWVYFDTLSVMQQFGIISVADGA